MPILNIYITDETLARLTKVAEELHCKVDDLAESSVEEAALTAFRNRNDDPARKSP